MNKKNLLSLLAACMILLSFNQSQAADHVTFSLQNATKTTNTIEFDVFVENDGTSALNLGGYQFGINYSTSILNGGTPGSSSFTYMAGTRDAAFTLLTNPSVQHSNSQMKVVASLVPYATSVPLTIGTQYRLGRFMFTNTVDWTTSGIANLQFQLTSAAGKTNSIALCYINSSVTSTTFNNANGLLNGVSTAVSNLTLNVPLPVTISSFTGHQQGSQDIIRWSTSQEINNAYFNLQYSQDGVNFNTIATLQSLAPNGTSNEVLNYEFAYSQPANGHNYYRLEQVDIDQQSTIKTNILDLIRSGNSTEITLYPNPVNDIIHINLNNENACNTVAQLFDLNGRIVKQVTETTNAGTQLISINTQECKNGNYFLRIMQNNKEVYSSQIVVRK